MTTDEQLKLWVEGKSVHNDDKWIEFVDGDGNVVERRKMDGGECCPDFSCCKPELQAPREVREAFAAASPRERDKFLMSFLTAAIELAGHADKVYIAGRDPEEEC